MGSGGSSTNSWGVWWCEENEYLQNLPLGLKTQCIIKPLVYVIIGLGIASPKLTADIAKMSKENMMEIVYTISGIAILVFVYFTINNFGVSPWIRRGGKLMVSIIVAIGVVKFIMTHYKYLGVFIGIYYIMSALSILACVFGSTTIRHAFRIHDLILGHFLFSVLFVLAALQVPKDIQTWLLFHNALSQGVVMDDILKYARGRQEASALDSDAVPVDESAELKKIIKHQEYMMSQLMKLQNGEQNTIKELRVKGQEMLEQEERPTTGEGLSAVEYLGDRDQTGVEVSGMMKASTSTLNFSQLAVGRSRPTQDQRMKSPHKGSSLVHETDSSLVSPQKFPPRDPA